MRWPEVKEWYAAYDYARLTRKPVHGPIQDALVCRRWLDEALVSGEGEVPAYEPWVWNGYGGYRSRYGAFGARLDGSIIQASSWAAQALWAVRPDFDGVPRCDLAVTVWLERDCPDTAERVADAASASQAGKGATARSVRLVKGYGNGDTAYIGARTSDSFIRVYDKWRESGKDEVYRYAWRIELQLAGAVAKAVWTASYGASSARSYLYSVVCRFAEQSGTPMPALQAADVLGDFREKREGDWIERRRAWLRNQVRPAIEKAMAAGLTVDAVLDELGLR